MYGLGERIERHCDALALYFTWYNFCRRHASLGTTPAVAARLAVRPTCIGWRVCWRLDDLCRDREGSIDDALSVSPPPYNVRLHKLSDGVVTLFELPI